MAHEQTPELERALQSATDRRASDLFLFPNEPVALRIDDRIERLAEDALAPAEVRRIAAAAVGEQRLATLGTEVSRIITSCGLPGVVDGRMCIASTRGEIAIAIQVLQSAFFSVETIELPPAVLAAAQSRHGLVIFTGRTGSGKTTSMMTVAEHLNRTAALHICTVEDPIAIIFTPKQSLVTQREVGVDVPDVLSGIVACMRQDPDVLVIGELKTPEEVQAAVTTAQTGHLVMTQLHATTPPRAIQRLYDSQPPEHLPVFRRRLAESLRGICAQVLLPRAGGKGRVPAYGVLIPDDEMREAIADGRDVRLRKGPLPEGSQEIEQEIDRLVREEKVTAAAAREAIQMLR